MTCFDILNIEYNEEGYLLDFNLPDTMRICVKEGDNWSHTEEAIRKQINNMEELYANDVKVVDFTAFYEGTDKPLRENYEDYEAETFDAESKRLALENAIEDWVKNNQPKSKSAARVKARIFTYSEDTSQKKVVDTSFGKRTIGHSYKERAKLFGKRYIGRNDIPEKGLVIAVSPTRKTKALARHLGGLGLIPRKVSYLNAWGYLIIPQKFFGAETFNVEFNEWADQEMMTHGKDISFKDWAEDEGLKHGNVPITDWAQHEEESHDARYGAEELKKDSCCCGATKSKPCSCMIQGVMDCNATCPCSLEKKGAEECEYCEGTETELTEIREDTSSGPIVKICDHCLDIAMYGAEEEEIWDDEDYYNIEGEDYWDRIEGMYEDFCEDWEDNPDNDGQDCPSMDEWVDTYGNFDAEDLNWGGDPKGKLAIALQKARDKAKEPKKPLKIEKLDAETITRTSYACSDCGREHEQERSADECCFAGCPHTWELDRTKDWEDGMFTMYVSCRKCGTTSWIEGHADLNSDSNSTPKFNAETSGQWDKTLAMINQYDMKENEGVTYAYNPTGPRKNELPPFFNKDLVDTHPDFNGDFSNENVVVFIDWCGEGGSAKDGTYQGMLLVSPRISKQKVIKQLQDWGIDTTNHKKWENFGYFDDWGEGKGFTTYHFPLPNTSLHQWSNAYVRDTEYDDDGTAYTTFGQDCIKCPKQRRGTIGGDVSWDMNAETSGQWEIGEQLEEAQMNAETFEGIPKSVSILSPLEDVRCDKYEMEVNFENEDIVIVSGEELKAIMDDGWDLDSVRSFEGAGMSLLFTRNPNRAFRAEDKKRKKISGVLSDPFDELSLDSGGIKKWLAVGIIGGLTIFGYKKWK